MKAFNGIVILVVLFSLFTCKNKISENLQYIDANKPSLTPKLFAPHFISKDSVAEFGSVFNKNGKEFFFGIDANSRAHINYTSLSDGKWSEPITIISHAQYSYNDPFLSPDEAKLYYISDQPVNEKDSTLDYNIWYSNRIESGWSEPINAGEAINTDANEFYISFANDGSMYFSTNKEHYKTRRRNYDIYKSSLKDGKFQTAVKLSEAVNTIRYEADVFISPDESYIIFCSIKKSGLGSGDLYISFKQADDSWTEAISMGEQINTKGHELCPFVSYDGKFFFYTSNQDIYWVSTDIINNIKKKVFD